YSFTGDPDTGMFGSAADTLDFSAGGISKLQIGPNNVTVNSQLNATSNLMRVGDNSNFVLSRPTNTSGAGADFLIQGQAAGIPDQPGGILRLRAGDAGGTGWGGDLYLEAGRGLGSGPDGELRVGTSSTSTIWIGPTGGGDTSVRFPTDAINSSEILDEAGVTSSTVTPPVTITTSITVLASRSVAAPADGFVLVIATGELRGNQQGGLSSSSAFGVSNSNTAFSGEPLNYSLFGGASNSIDIPVTVHGLFPVGAGNNTFYFLGRKNHGLDFQVARMRLTLLFVPTSYTVQSLTSESSGWHEFRTSVQDSDSRLEPDRLTKDPATDGNGLSRRKAPELEQIKRQQAEIDELKRVVCSVKFDPVVCKEVKK
ncbi:MAG TPA: hypothetical protein VJL58_06925, partial [Pyrinomonadaceae bacterium]|nr:hypothetical protein [Pyrinomonadaceae bacterium]